MMHFASAQKIAGANDEATMENADREQTVRLSDTVESGTPLPDMPAEEHGTITFDDLVFGDEAGRIYYTVQTPELNESLKYSVSYLSEKLIVSDLKLSVDQWDIKKGLADSETLRTLKTHLTADRKSVV